MAYRRKSNKLVWCLILAGLVVVGAKFSQEVKKFVAKIPLIGPMIYPDLTTSEPAK